MSYLIVAKAYRDHHSSRYVVAVVDNVAVASKEAYAAMKWETKEEAQGVCNTLRDHHSHDHTRWRVDEA